VHATRPSRTTSSACANACRAAGRPDRATRTTSDACRSRRASLRRRARHPPRRRGHDPERAEIAFLELCRAGGLPRPRANAQVEGLEVDFLFPVARLAVETDSWRFHRTRRDFERDRARDALLAAAGYRTLRFTDRQITAQPATVVAAIRAAAEAATGRPGGAP
jgi:very-short-patch-repair endonuclease